MKSFSELKTTLSSSDTVPFGKYQGETFEYLLEHDPKYIQWIAKNTDIKLSQYLLEECEKVKKPEQTGWSRFDTEDWDQDVPF